MIFNKAIKLNENGTDYSVSFSLDINILKISGSNFKSEFIIDVSFYILIDFFNQLESYKSYKNYVWTDKLFDEDIIIILDKETYDELKLKVAWFIDNFDSLTSTNEPDKSIKLEIIDVCDYDIIFKDFPDIFHYINALAFDKIKTPMISDTLKEVWINQDNMNLDFINEIRELDFPNLEIKKIIKNVLEMNILNLFIPIYIYCLNKKLDLNKLLNEYGFSLINRRSPFIIKFNTDLLEKYNDLYDIDKKLFLNKVVFDNVFYEKEATSEINPFKNAKDSLKLFPKKILILNKLKAEKSSDKLFESKYFIILQNIENRLLDKTNNFKSIVSDLYLVDKFIIPELPNSTSSLMVIKIILNIYIVEMIKRNSLDIQAFVKYIY